MKPGGETGPGTPKEGDREAEAPKVEEGEGPDEKPEVEKGVVAEGNPYKLLERDGQYVIVNAETGKVVPGGNHGSDKGKAMAHFRALEAAYHREEK